MTAAARRRAARDDSTNWVDASTRAALELVAEGVTELVGFDVAAISVVIDDELEVVAVSGNDSAREVLEGSRTAIGLTEELIDLSDDWGVLRFVPHERSGDYLSRHGWTPPYEPLAVADAWHAEDMLFAPFVDASGALQGLLAVDLPSDGLRPGPTKRRQLEKYANQAGRAVVTAIERARLAQQVRLASRARQAVREASRELSLDRLLVQCQDDLLAGFRSHDMWVHTLDDGSSPAAGDGVLYTRSGITRPALPRELVDTAEVAARRAWAARRVDIVTAGAGTAGWTADELDVLRASLAAGAHSALFVPLGEGRTCLGSMVLVRGVDDPDWTDNDIAVALDVGSDLGHAIAHARAFEREQALVRELQALDSYKSELIATLSHELKTPLSSILGNLELLEATETVTPDGLRSLSAIERGTQRLVRVVDDLMLLAKIGDPTNPLVARPVDLVALVEDVLAMTAATVRQRSLEVTFTPGPEPVLAAGDAGELDRVVTNIVSNATKYTHVGGRIEIAVERVDDSVVVTCTDDGIGISAADQQRLFREFFRSTNPQALVVPGTGLGLAIVERIVTRHGGRIAVRSEPGHGSTFEVVLPAAVPSPASLDASLASARER